MAFDVQTLIVLAIVGAASAYVARQVWASIFARKASACGSCRNCGTTEKPRDVFSITTASPGKHTG
jgi:hypothetical protein